MQNKMEGSAVYDVLSIEIGANTAAQPFAGKACRRRCKVDTRIEKKLLFPPPAAPGKSGKLHPKPGIPDEIQDQ